MRRFMLLGALSVVPFAHVIAQAPNAAPARPGTEQRVEGRVRRPLDRGGDSTGMGPAINTWVTLHRVGKDSAGPVDSVRTDAAGRYRMRWTPFGANDAVYFASVRWGGIAYFTAPLRSAVAQGDEAEITVFDTTSRTFPLAVKGRHLIVGQLDSAGSRTVIEVFELSNDSLRTLISPEGANAHATWSTPVPQAAQDVRLTQGEISADAFTHSPGLVSIAAPIAPGLKQVAFSYRLPATSFPINVVAQDGAVVFEVLLEEPQGAVRGDGFTAVAPVTIEQRRFARFLAQDVKPGGTVTIELPLAKSPGRPLYIASMLVALGLVVLLVLSRVVQGRASRGTGEPVTPSRLRAAAIAATPELPLHERLAREIAALDAMYARQTSPSEGVRAAYEARRSELKDALADALASAPNAR
jgi:hypothetical protein